METAEAVGHNDASRSRMLSSVNTSNPSIMANFNADCIYYDRYQNDSFDLTEEMRPMDPELRQFLVDEAKVSSIYIDSLLTPNGIRTYEDFKKLAVDTHAFTNMEHIYTKLGANALGNQGLFTSRLLLLGQFIAQETNNVHIYDPKTKIFNPRAFPSDAWQRYYGPNRRSFGGRFDLASSETYMKHQNSLQIIDGNATPGAGLGLSKSLSTIPSKSSHGRSPRHNDRPSSSKSASQGVPPASSIEFPGSKPSSEYSSPGSHQGSPANGSKSNQEPSGHDSPGNFDS